MFTTHLLLESSATLAMNSKALEKRARGERVYNLSAGEPMLTPHQAVVDGALAAMKAGKTRYPPVAGIPELRAAASSWMNRMYQTTYTPEQTLVTCGGKFGIFALCQALVQKGDGIAIVAPYWVSYPEIVKIFGGTPHIVESHEENGWKITAEDLNTIGAPCKILILNNGANPTGALYSREEIVALLAWAKEHDCVVISDEVYSGLVYDGNTYTSCGSFPEYQDRVVVIQSCSKHFAMTGWRVGFLFGPVEIVRTISMLQSQSTTGTASISQWAAVAAFEHADEIVSGVRAALETRRNVLVKALETQMGHTYTAPASALYMFISLKDLGVENTDSVAFCMDLIEKHNIATVPGSAFGKEGYVRFSFGETEQELEETIQAVRGAIGQ